MLRKAAGLGGKTAFLTAFEAEKEKRRKAADEAIRKYGHLFV
jgi:hypothetical protein